MPVHPRSPFSSCLRSLAAAGLILAGTSARAEPQIHVSTAKEGAIQIRVVDAAPAGCQPSAGPVWARGLDVHFALQPAPGPCRNAPPAERFELVSAPVRPAVDGLNGARALRVHVLDARDGRLLGFALAGGRAPAEPPESGLWWPEAGGEFDTSGPGLGVQIEVQDRTLALTVAGYDALGAPTWWFGAAPLDTAPTLIELSALQGGAGPFARYTPPGRIQPAGRLLIEWLGPARAVFWFLRAAADRDELELRPISMTRFSFGLRPGEGWAGDWVLVVEQDAEAARTELHRFDWAGGDEHRFELASDRGLRLVCRRAAGAPEQVPEGCQLWPEDGEGEVWDLPDIGIGRLSGGSGGQRVRLLRLR